MNDYIDKLENKQQETMHCLSLIHKPDTEQEIERIPVLQSCYFSTVDIMHLLLTASEVFLFYTQTLRLEFHPFCL